MTVKRQPPAGPPNRRAGPSDRDRDAATLVAVPAACDALLVAGVMPADHHARLRAWVARFAPLPGPRGEG